MKKCVVPENWHLNSDSSYDVDGNVQLSKRYVSGGKLRVRFRKVTGDFNCDGMNLRTLLGCPSEVDGTFSCCGNKLATLEGGPKIVGKDYICNESQLSSLVGAPKMVPGDFICESNLLRLLTGAPTRVAGNFSCHHNDIFTLEGGPKTVGRDYICSFNRLTDLNGAPKVIPGDFYCNSNRLASLNGGPKRVKGEFNCENNKLLYFDGVVGMTKLRIFNNPLKDFHGKYLSQLMNGCETWDRLKLHELGGLKQLFNGIRRINWKDFHGSIQKYINWLPENIHIEHINLNSKQQKELHAIQISRI